MRNYKLNASEIRPSLINGQDALFRAVFDGSPDAIFLLHPEDFQIVDCNSKALKLFQADYKKDFSELNIFSLYESEPVEFSKNSLIDNINSGREHSQELPLKSLKGNIFWGSFSARRVDAADGAVVICRVSRVVDYMKTAEMLSTMIKQTSKATGYKYFSVLTELLCKSFGVGLAMVARIDKANNKAISVNCWNKGESVENLSFDLEVSPSLNVMRGYTTFYPSNLAEMFPDDKLIRKYNLVGYLGTPVYCAAGEVCGLLILMDDKQMEEIPNSRYVLSIFASRAGAEFERIQVEESYQQKIRELEGR